VGATGDGHQVLKQANSCLSCGVFPGASQPNYAMQIRSP
jgi:hypothetical protein